MDADHLGHHTRADLEVVHSSAILVKHVAPPSPQNQNLCWFYLRAQGSKLVLLYEIGCEQPGLFVRSPFPPPFLGNLLMPSRGCELDRGSMAFSCHGSFLVLTVHLVLTVVLTSVFPLLEHWYAMCPLCLQDQHSSLMARGNCTSSPCSDSTLRRKIPERPLLL